MSSKTQVSKAKKDVKFLIYKRELDENGNHYSISTYDDPQAAFNQVKVALRCAYFDGFSLEEFAREEQQKTTHYLDYKREARRLRHLWKDGNGIWIPTWERRGHGIYFRLFRVPDSNNVLRWKELDNSNTTITLAQME